ncbi:MAG: PEP-CTERM sorting domain-containing protein [Armatimonadetes bacterium]|nr:PEP-CTERM sorting domain-containing protein [Armatimonadota bacterium]
MKAKILVTLVGLATSLVANAQTSLMDHINGTQKDGQAANSQVYGDIPTFSSSVVDDYTGTGFIGTAEADMMCYNSPFSSFAQWDAGRFYQLSTYASLAGAIADLKIATVIVPSSSFVQDPQGFGPLSARVRFTGLNLFAPLNGWFGIQGIGDFSTSGQIGVLGSTYGSGGAANNAELVNPSGGYGLPGNHIPLSGLGMMGNAKYHIETVPEPASMLALGAGLVSLLARRRKS